MFPSELAGGGGSKDLCLLQILRFNLDLCGDELFSSCVRPVCKALKIAFNTDNFLHY